MYVGLPGLVESKKGDIENNNGRPTDRQTDGQMDVQTICDSDI